MLTIMQATGGVLVVELLGFWSAAIHPVLQDITLKITIGTIGSLVALHTIIC